MQLNRQLITIIILIALLISAITTGLFFYKKSKDALKNKNELVAIYIAKDNIAKNTLLEEKHLTMTKIAKQFILNKPLIKKEILGKYTNENIYKNEVFLKQKLDTKIKKEKKKILPFEKSAYNMQFNIFKNPNYALQQGEYINIVSVFPKGETDKKGRYLDFDVKYVAPSIKILGFIRNGRYESETITKHQVKKIENKKLVTVNEEIKADELILDIDLDILLKLIKNYNLGTQLWMTKTKYTQVQEVSKKVVNEDIKASRKKIVKKVFNKKYQYKRYVPEEVILKKSAIIDYGEDKEELKIETKNVNIKIESKRLCENSKDKFLLGNTNRFYIRSSASTSSKYKRILYKNTIIPFIYKVNDWYKTCDGRFVHKNVVKEVSASFVKNKIGKYE